MFQGNMPISSGLYFKCHSNLVDISFEIEPTCYEESLKDPWWIFAMQSEIDALVQNHTW